MPPGPGLATQQAVPLPKTCRTPSIADGRQEAAQGHTGGPAVPPKGCSIPAAAGPGHTAGWRPREMSLLKVVPKCHTQLLRSRNSSQATRATQMLI